MLVSSSKPCQGQKQRSSSHKPDHVWEETWKWLCDGILYDQRNIANNQGLVLSDEELQNLTLLEIEKLLQQNQRSLRDYPQCHTQRDMSQVNWAID
ncbi:hypothetical protein Lal_00039788 [Lupinus albus]|nr:hypothetical protein Lal_00039788 [Lupinus albus]